MLEEIDLLGPKKEFGNVGEDIAVKYLKSIEYEILIKNFRCRSGEIDIIAKDNDEIVFVEVKTRRSLNCGTPAESIDNTKIKHIYRASEYYLYKNEILDAFSRFDVIEVYFVKNRYKLIHLKDVILE